MRNTGYYRKCRRCIERKVIKNIAVIILVICSCEILGAFFHAIALYDRSALRQDTMLLELTDSQKQLQSDARAQIIVSLVNAAKRSDRLQPEEKHVIGENWETANYDLFEPNPFEGK